MIETQRLEKVSSSTKNTSMFIDSTLLLFMEEEVVQMMERVLLFAESNLKPLLVMKHTGSC